MPPGAHPSIKVSVVGESERSETAAYAIIEAMKDQGWFHERLDRSASKSGVRRWSLTFRSSAKYNEVPDPGQGTLRTVGVH